MSKLVRQETTRVYRAAGRRFFTLRSAARAIVRAKIRERCQCERGDSFDDGFACHYHVDPEHYEALINRGARHVMRAFRAAPPPSLETEET